jgi:two-component system chemotaxis sensor kinase CheA
MGPFEQLMGSFREEAGELLAELEATLLELDGNLADPELVDRAFRALHTIKGTAGMFGFEEITAFTHDLETTFDQMRGGGRQATRELVALALQGKDLVRAMLQGEGEKTRADRERLLTELRRHLSSGEPPPAPAAAAQPEAAAKLELFRVQLQPKRDLLQNGTNPLALLAELRSLGACEVVCHAGEVPPLEDIASESCYLSWDAILSTDRGLAAVRDVFIFVEDRAELRIDRIEAGDQGADAGPKRLGEILVERGELSAQDLERVLAERKRIGELLTEKKLVSPESVESALAEQRLVRQQRETHAPATESSSSVRVGAKKLDELVDLVGELVIAQARLSRIAGRREDPELLAIAEEIDRLSGALRDNTLDVRMVPIGTTFSRFKRLVHDLSLELNKEIELVTDGADTKLDKTVIEKLADPLMHVIRNACDHGIERPEARHAAGKPAKGTVRLLASHAGASVLVEIQDDGAGMDVAALRAKGVERGIFGPEESPPEKELFNLIFLPGLSTAREVSKLSGRGVGMDVVKRTIDGLHGTVEVESAPGGGTTFRIRLPLTLAIIEGLQVAVGESSYVLPLSVVEECVELTRQDVDRAAGAHVATVRGELIPYVRLRELFDVEGARPAIEQVAIVTVEGSRYGLAVDDVVGQHQTVIKGLGRMYQHVKGLSGATVLGDGTVALIVDVPALIRCAETTGARVGGRVRA